MNGIAKISDFGVAHMFEDERSSWSIMQNGACGGDDNDPINELLSDDEDDNDCEKKIDAVGSPTHLSKLESEEAINMSSRHSSGMLKKTEGTLYFFAPEMCSLEKQAFSGYAADLWAAGVCLHIFVTGKLPFFALNPSNLFEMIVQNEPQYDKLDLSNELKSLLRKLLTKDPSIRAGVGDCLKHNFCKDARAQRIQELGTEFQQSTGDIVLTDTDINLALSITMISNAFNPTSRQKPRRSISEQRVPDTKRTHSKLDRSMKFEKDTSLLNNTERDAKQQTKRPSMLKELFKVGYFRRKKNERADKHII
jgi:serine/threonine protein kinase